MAGLGLARPELEAAVLAWARVLVSTAWHTEVTKRSHSSLVLAWLTCMVPMVLSRVSWRLPPVLWSQAVQSAVKRSPVPTKAAGNLGMRSRTTLRAPVSRATLLARHSRWSSLR